MVDRGIRVRLLEWATPVATLLLALGASFAPFSTSADALIGPHWIFVVAGFWVQRRPGAATPPTLFLIGIVYEALRDGPLGVEVAALLIATEGLRYAAQRRQAYSLVEDWLRFAIGALALEAIVWLILAATYAPTPAITALLLRWVATVLAYPLVAFVLGRLPMTRPLDAPGAFGAPDPRGA